ncbi:glycosyltransferase [Algoriphagus boritolerans]|uniref:Glycosyltransferase involved in cell wall bisynthesis n=1 Tax=Algoriphagus boritolerans DSM 17298 = JCM 18970 TaxID=1120964 RepID=A0A1H5X8F6_9BACT|nr:glycosyltransferase [Algoriphagus boritolerans]SEG07546.1 Glycosyltransferase involved in cell wall bisynthesis [Algoriphagus boritolerans DSM 17298 = JCM 18970]
MDNTDLVTVICIAFNHEEWIEETLESVRSQDYYAKELIIVDNGSTDKTAEKIRNWVNESSGLLSVVPVFYEEMQPYCQLFNQILAEAKGHYVIDLSGDDVLYPDHLSHSLEVLKMAPFAAFVFSDAYIMDQMGEVRTFYKRNNAGQLIEEIELSNIYETLIRRNFICSPTLVFNKAILIKEGGYDESLYYEDFDIQVRLSRNHPVVFSDHIGVLKRKHSRSMSALQYQVYQSKMLPSTVKVCSKIRGMNIYPEENKALKKRILYELKHALWSANFGPARELVVLGEEIGMKGLKFWIYKLWAKKGWDLSWMYLKLT